MILAAAIAIMSLPVFAEETVLEKASESYIQEALATCKGYALEDGVSATELDKYLLQCINDDLEENNYEKITELPKAS